MRAAAEQGGGKRARYVSGDDPFCGGVREEQGLLGATHLVEWAKQQGYTVGGMLDDDIVVTIPLRARRIAWAVFRQWRN